MQISIVLVINNQGTICTDLNVQNGGGEARTGTGVLYGFGALQGFLGFFFFLF